MGARYGDKLGNRVKQALQQSADFLSDYLSLANGHPTDFIIDDIWARLVPSEIQEQLLALSHHDLCMLPQNQRRDNPGSDTPVISNRLDSTLDELSTSFGGIAIQTEECQTDTNESVATKHPKNLDWKHGSLHDFLVAVQNHCLENLSFVWNYDTLTQWLQENNQAPGGSVPFVHAFMKTKKSHEVEIMADVCTRLFNKIYADVVVDLGSGKGYLSTHLSLQSGLPVLAIDSQPMNTSGAQKRADKLSKQWPALVNNERKTKQRLKQGKAQKSAEHDVLGEIHSGDGACVKEAVKCNSCGTGTSVEMAPEGSNKELGLSTDCDVDSSDSVCSQPQMSSSSGHDNSREKSWLSGQASASAPEKEQKHSGASETEKPKCTLYSSRPRPSCAAVTMFVGPQTNLSQVVQDESPGLCPEKNVKSLRLLLTGLHTCGALGANMLRIFTEDESVKAICGVGCCYQLMEERFADESSRGAADCETDKEEMFDFPLSSLLTERRMTIGRTALNMASLALSRMTSHEGELQGATFYPRALLQALLKERLGHIPSDLKRLRGLARKVSSPCDYVIAALRKLNIPGCQVTEDEVAKFHQQHSHHQHKMAAFFQLRAALAPLVETVVLLDRLLYLVEQDCVRDAFLVRLFDPVTSPRCHAIVAVKM